MKNTIYHYCSLQSFESIIKNKTLRLSNSFKTNDSLEMNWIFSILKESGHFDSRYIETLKMIYNEYLNYFFRPHMICFSKEPDLLSQWRGYANDGKGVCIGFNKEYFNKSKLLNEHREFEIYEVKYVKKLNLELDFLKNYSFEKLLSLVSTDLSQGKNIVPLINLTKDLYNLGVFYKNPAFKEEKEIRFVHGYPEMAAEPDMFNFVFNDDNMKSYVSISLDFRDLFPVIDEIIIGPKCKILSSDLDQFVKLNIAQFDIKYQKSKCSFI